MRALMCVVVLSLTTSALAQDDAAPGAADSKAAKPAKAELDVTKMKFSQESVRKVIVHNNDKIQGCYEETLAGRDKPVEGKVMTSFVITAEGLVKQAKVLKKGTTINDDKLHTCLISTLSALTFPAPTDKRDHPIEYPFNLKAVH
jgi:hypothetical protein